MIDDNVIFIGNSTINSIGSSSLVCDSDFDELKKEVEHLKKLHDYDYAKQCVLDELNEEYNSMIRTDIWYEAAKKYLNDKINTCKFDLLINNFYSNKNLGFIYDSCGGSLVYSNMEFDINDGTNKKISIKDLHNAYPDVKLEDDFKQFCIEYRRNNGE